MAKQVDVRAAAQSSPNISGPEVDSTIVLGHLRIDLRARSAYLQGRHLELTSREFGLLECLATHPGWVFSKERLLELVWGYDFGDARTVSVHLGNLRRKLGDSHSSPRYIHTIRGMGYKLEYRSREGIGRGAPASPLGKLVGRDEELTALLSLWDEVLSGKGGRVALISGEAGIGKTRLAQELSRRAADGGNESLWGRSYESEGTPAYLPWSQVVRCLVESDGGSSIVSELGPRNQTLARLCPERFTDEGGFALLAEESAAARFRLFEAVVALLRVASGKLGPLLVVLDDLHDADPASLSLLAYLARDLVSLPVFLVACYRRELLHEEGPLSSALASLAREGATRQLDLDGLDEGRVAEILEEVGGRPAPTALAWRVWDETRGNPFFVTEVARLLVAQGAFEGDARALPELPDGVKAVIDRRITSLTQATVRLLEVAAVSGREFSFALLERVRRAEPDGLLEALEEARAAQIIEPLPQPHRFRFVHNLLRQTLYDRTPLPTRARLHGEIGNAIESLAVGSADVDVDELAHHYLEASPLGWRHKALDYRLKAARAAMNRYAWENSREHFEQALSLVCLVSPAVTSDVRVEIWEGLGDARLATEKYEEARVAYLEAIALCTGDERLARSRLRRKIGRSYKEERLFVEAVDASNEAEAELGQLTLSDDPSLWREWLDGRLERIRSLHYAGQGEAMGLHLQEIAPMIEKYGSPIQLTVFLGCHVANCWKMDGGVTSDECLGYARAQVETATAANLRAYLPFAEALLAAALQQRPEVTEADLFEAEKHAQLALRAGEKVGDMEGEMIALANLAINARMRHDVDLTRHWAEACASRPRNGEWPDMAAFGAANLAWAHWYVGNLVEARRYAEQALAAWAFTPQMPYGWVGRLPALAAALEEGRLEEAMEHSRGLLAPFQQRLPTPLTEALKASLRSGERADWGAARAALERSVELARKYRFL